MVLVIRQHSQTCIGCIQQLWITGSGLEGTSEGRLVQPPLPGQPQSYSSARLRVCYTRSCSGLLTCSCSCNSVWTFPYVNMEYFKDNKKYLKYSLEEVGLEEKVWWIALGISFQGTCMNLYRDFPPTSESQKNVSCFTFLNFNLLQSGPKLHSSHEINDNCQQYCLQKNSKYITSFRKYFP